MLVPKSARVLDAQLLESLSAGGDPSPHPDIRLYINWGSLLIINPALTSGWINNVGAVTGR
jgi:hypothetical protein